jgi:hypothetical protein
MANPARRFPPPWNCQRGSQHIPPNPSPDLCNKASRGRCPLVAANSTEIEKVRSFLLQIREKDHAAPLGGIVRVILSPLVIFPK